MLLPLDRARLASRMVPTSMPLEGDQDFKSATPDPTTVVKVLILVSVFGWVFFGIMSILCINGRGRAGRGGVVGDSYGAVADHLAGFGGENGGQGNGEALPKRGR
ncbi:hypothetical protein BGZ61DRAFT_475305 [Ilyonectria robusta]|uniref:uncharacterized protein n=1 Tax=Ilyonectria robusta TaxID=1079257 RepID=UPI001E8EDF89|nr:uncharacterized protein BGZ61DRAFT_475305 [Ilyonectria robusta]KAH8729730.1 hypothetical protein BGZ61DRAFT_475305 [Ilyonectria robusta]